LVSFQKSKLSTESVGSRRALVANYCVHTADADVTQLDKFTNITLHNRFECLQTCSVICYVICYFYSIGCRIVNLVTAMGCVHIAESVGSRRELVANACTHRRRRRDSTAEWRRVGGVNAPVGSLDPVYDVLCC